MGNIVISHNLALCDIIEFPFGLKKGSNIFPHSGEGDVPVGKYFVG